MAGSSLHKGPGEPGRAIPEQRDKFESHMLRGKRKFIALDHRVWIRGGNTVGVLM